MRVLVIAASKHGSTTDIAEVLAGELYAHGHDSVYADVADKDLPDVADFDAVVVGSSVYGGHWLKPARRFVEVNADALSRRPVWLFSSGPLGDPPEPTDDAVEVDKIVSDLGAVEHHVFSGSLNKDDLGPIEKGMVRAVRAPYGDFRDWDDVRHWAAQIADRLPEPT